MTFHAGNGPLSTGSWGSRAWCSGHSRSCGVHTWPSEWLFLSTARARGGKYPESTSRAFWFGRPDVQPSHWRRSGPVGRRAASTGAGPQGADRPLAHPAPQAKRADSASGLERATSLLWEPLSDCPGLSRARTQSDQTWENMPEVWERNRMRPVPSFPVLLSQGIKFQNQQLKGRKPRIVKIPWKVLSGTSGLSVWVSVCNSEWPFSSKLKLENLRARSGEGSQHAGVWARK